MAIDLASAFGSSELIVAYGARQVQRRFDGFAGAHGVTSMHLGTRGYPLQVRGRIRITGASYDTVRPVLASRIRDMEALTWAPAADYSWHGDTYGPVVWEHLQLLPGPDGRTIRGVGGTLWLAFVMTGRALL